MKLWGGRFLKNNTAAMEAFHSSISFDMRLYRQDIEGSVAHAKMLAKQGIIAAQEGEEIINALHQILDDIENGRISFNEQAEDIHMNIENILIERIGDAGRRLHTARSRNDQVALDMRMYMKVVNHEIMIETAKLIELLLNRSEDNVQTIMPGYTHMQKAQPISLAHHLLAYVSMFSRDLERLQDCYKRTDVMPLGSGALATSTYPIDRAFVAKELYFSSISQNSLDAVSDRDFCIEFCSTASIIMMHLSRFCEELILWSSEEFSFVEIDDAYSTGSSIMPQKKNPDAAELIRGKTGRVYGNLIALLSMMKSLPLAYNKDMQEDKEATFDTVDTLIACLSIFTSMLKSLKFNTDNMSKSAESGYINATDIADYLVKKSMPFRSAHEIVGKLVLDAIESNRNFDDYNINELKAYSDLFDEDFYVAIKLERCLKERKAPGGPAPQATQAQIANKRAWLSEFCQQNNLI